MAIIDSVATRKNGDGPVWPWVILAAATTTAAVVVRQRVQQRRREDAKIDAEAREQDEAMSELTAPYWTQEYENIIEPLGDNTKMSAVDFLPGVFPPSRQHKVDDHSKDGTEETFSSFISETFEV